MPADVANASELLHRLSEPLGPGERANSALERASRLAGLRYWRAFDIWYGKARRIEDREFEKIQTALRIKQESAARNELHDLKLRLAILEARLSAGDADFHRLDIDSLRSVLDGPGGSGRPLARRK
jgi:hypothetical protein